MCSEPLSRSGVVGIRGGRSRSIAKIGSTQGRELTLHPLCFSSAVETHPGFNSRTETLRQISIPQWLMPETSGSPRFTRWLAYFNQRQSIVLPVHQW